MSVITALLRIAMTFPRKVYMASAKVFYKWCHPTKKRLVAILYSFLKLF